MNNIILPPKNHNVYRYDIYDDTLVIYRPFNNVVDIYKIENNKWIKKNEFITNDSKTDDNSYYSITLNYKYIYISFINFIQVYELINNEYINIKKIDKININVINEEVFNTDLIYSNIRISNDYYYINNNNIVIYGNYDYYLTILPDYTTIFTTNQSSNGHMEKAIGIDNNNLLYTVDTYHLIKIRKLNNENNMWITYKEIDYSIFNPSRYYIRVFNHYSVSKDGKYIAILYQTRIKNEETTDYDDFYYYTNILVYEKYNLEEYKVVFNYQIEGELEEYDGITINNNILTFYDFRSRKINFFMKINNKWSLTNQEDNYRIYISDFHSIKSNNKSINLMTVYVKEDLTIDYRLIYTII